jgi:hypothetical protein
MIEIHNIIYFSFERVHHGITTELKILYLNLYGLELSFFYLLKLYFLFDFHLSTFYLLEIEHYFFF